MTYCNNSLTVALTRAQQPNGIVLMTYYNNGGFGAFASKMPLNDRCYMWLVAGHEVGGELQWTQPELVLYDSEHTRGHGYPDVITTDDGAVYITETYKGAPASEARTHAVPSEIPAALFAQRTVDTVRACC
jgi:hypothetical protein